MERFLSAPKSILANLGFLGVVAFWRVVLITQVIRVLYFKKLWRALFIVLFFADTIVLFVLVAVPIPIIQFMGGIRLTESERIIQSTAFLVGAVSIVTWPIWLIGAGIAIFKKDGEELTLQSNSQQRVSTSAWLVAIVSLLIWIPILPIPQSEQQLRRSVESDLINGHIKAALMTMSKHQQDDFPPHWDPPPRIGYGEVTPRIIDVVETAHSLALRDWVFDLFLKKFNTVSRSRMRTLCGKVWTTNCLTDIYE